MKTPDMTPPGQPFKLEEYIMSHMKNSQEWHLPFLPTIHLPEPLSLHAVMVLLCSFFLIILFCFAYRKNQTVPNGLTNLLEMFILFVRNEIAINTMGIKDGKRLTPLLCTFFFFILGMNLMGMIPIFSTATANLNVTGGLALATLTLMITESVKRKGMGGFLKSFVPAGVPFPINGFLWIVEFILMFVKPFALMIRLFANMLAGHFVILSMLGLVITIGVIAMPTILIGVAVALLEIMVAFIQAYIFTMLSALFIGMMLSDEH